MSTDSTNEDSTPARADSVSKSVRAVLGPAFEPDAMSKRMRSVLGKAGDPEATSEWVQAVLGPAFEPDATSKRIKAVLGQAFEPDAMSKQMKAVLGPTFNADASSKRMKAVLGQAFEPDAMSKQMKAVLGPTFNADAMSKQMKAVLGPALESDATSKWAQDVFGPTFDPSAMSKTLTALVESWETTDPAARAMEVLSEASPAFRDAELAAMGDAVDLPPASTDAVAEFWSLAVAAIFMLVVINAWLAEANRIGTDPEEINRVSLCLEVFGLVGMAWKVKQRTQTLFVRALEPGESKHGSTPDER